MEKNGSKEFNKKKYCPYCKTLLANNVNFCIHCGRDLRYKYTSTKDEGAKVNENDFSRKENIYCTKCGNKLPPNSEYCNKCGKRQTYNTSSIIFNKKFKICIVAIACASVSIAIGVNVYNNYAVPDNTITTSLRLIDDADVYTTKLGHKYHKYRCNYVKDKSKTKKMTKKQAEADGYEPCKVCKP